METEIERVKKEYTNHSKMAQDLAKTPFVSSIAEMEFRYGKDLDARSHGESFLKLFQARFIPHGFYILDEPEAPLSPVSQLSLITMIKEMVDQGCQFLVATHSPILMAYPDATILSLDDVPIKKIVYEDIEHVKFMRAFLNDPDNFVHRL